MRPRTALLAFLCIGSFCAAWPLFVSIGIGGFYASLIASWVHLLSATFVVVAIAGYVRESPLPQIELKTGLVKIYTAVVVMLFAYGLLRMNRGYYAASEAWGFLLIGAFAVIGRYDQVWEDILKPMLVMFWIGVLLIVFGLSRRGSHDWSDMSLALGWTEGAAGGSRFVNSLGFDLRHMLYFWVPLFSMSAFGRLKGFWKLAGLTTPVAVFAIGAILFEFRSELILTATTLFMVLAVIPMLRKRLQLKQGLLIMGVALVAFAVIWSKGEMAGLMERFESKGMSDSRTYESQGMLMDLSSYEYVVGRGMGGWYRPPAGWTAGVEAIRGTSEAGRYQVHIGIMLTVLKGGLLLFVLYLMLIVRTLWPRGAQWYENPYNASAIVITVVYLVRQMMVPMPGINTFLWLAAIGLSCGRAGTLIDFHEGIETDEMVHYGRMSEQVSA